MNTTNKINHLIKTFPDIVVETYSSLNLSGKVIHCARVRGLSKKEKYPSYDEIPIRWHRSTISIHKAMKLALKAFMGYNKLSLKDISGYSKSHKT